MCLAIFFLHHFSDSPLALAANREEVYARPTRGPRWWPDEPGIFGGRDEVAGGTWLGVNRSGVLAAVTNRAETGAAPPRASDLRSRGLLCVDALRLPSSTDALAWVSEHLHDVTYSPFNLLLADSSSAYVIHYVDGPRICEVSDGVHYLADSDLDDPGHGRIARARALAAAELQGSWRGSLEPLQRIMADHDGGVPPRDQMCRHFDRAGTVSSSLVGVPGPEGQEATYLYAPGPPCSNTYIDLSLQLRDAGVGALQRRQAAPGADRAAS
ncbi:NRDE family protein [Candidatus Latescibacterota bacterium]